MSLYLALSIGFILVVGCQPPEVSSADFLNANRANQASGEGKTAVEPTDCAVGFVCAPGKPPEKCRAGFYCPNGEVIVASGLGYYTEEGQSFPTPCGRGFFCPNASNTAQDRKACRALPPDAEFVSDTEWTEACGYGCKSGYRLESEQCKPLTPCQAGYHCPPSSQAPFGAGKCPPGFFCPEGTTDYSKNLCDEGFFCSEGSDKSTGAGVCAVGHICPKGSKVATEIASGKGFFSDGRQRLACGKGMYCPKDANGPEDRKTCSNKPEESEYIDDSARTEECAFKCRAGSKLVENKCIATNETTATTTMIQALTTTTMPMKLTTSTTTTTIRKSVGQCGCRDDMGGPRAGTHFYAPSSSGVSMSGYGVTRDPSDCSLLLALRVRSNGITNDQHGIGKICESSMDWDTTFGNGGISYFKDASNTASGQHIALDSSTGKIFTAGIWRPGSYGSPFELVLLRWNRDGTLDTAFGTSGRVKLAYTVNNSPKSILTYGLLVNSAAVYVYGNITGVGGAIWKFSKAGILDASFGSSGVAINANIMTGNSASRAVLNSDGNILYAGKLGGSGFEIALFNGVSGKEEKNKSFLDVANYSSGYVMGMLANANNDGAALLVGTTVGGVGYSNIVEIERSAGQIDAKPGPTQSLPFSIYEPNTYVAWDVLRRPYVMMPSRFFDSSTCFLSLRLLAADGQVDTTWGQSGYGYTDCDASGAKNPYRYGVDGLSTPTKMIMLMFDNNGAENMAIQVSNENFAHAVPSRFTHQYIVPPN